ncbi:HWE histidine kinase domain-containing protein [Rhizobium sp.]|uniref:sensor histidine kinase n=1 Tax=Rhizobium sp. TaxID=391 RepID=UPI00289F5EF9
MPSDLQADPFRFLGHDGEAARIIREYDWASTPLGPAEDWPPCLRTSTALLLQSPVPIVMLWGEQGVMIYNDAYSVFAGGRHPELLGSKVREGWPEVADFNDNVMKVGLAGGTLGYRDQELTLHRTGQPEQVWMDLDYFPVLDEEGKPAGVFAIVVETTERVVAERRNKEEFQRLHNLFEQAPTFMAMLGGVDHRFEMVNPEYQKLVGNRELLGRTVEEALPELSDQGFLALLQSVFETGRAIRKTAEPIQLNRSEGAALEERFVDFVYQPIRNESGTITNIFVQGSDVTERVVAENRQRLLINELNHRVKNTLASIQSVVSQTLRGAHSKEDASKAITDRILALSRAHNVLTEENWDSADLRSMVDSAIDPFRIKDRIRIQGPELRVGPHAAMSIALALHELGTNALKYGALSASEGTVAVEWTLEDSGEFNLVWEEKGGPPVETTDRSGFGSRLILQALPRELGGTTSLEFRSAGVMFTLTSDIDSISDRPAADGV